MPLACSGNKHDISGKDKHRRKYLLEIFNFSQMKYLKPLTLFKESLKNYSVLFGLSVCDKHVGLAISTEFKTGAYPYLAHPRDENFLDTLVNRIETHISEDSGNLGCLDGIIVGKNPVGLIDEMCKTGKFKDLKYTYWEDNIASMRAEHKSKALMDIFARHGPPPPVDMFSSNYMLQGYLDFCNTLLHQSDPLLHPRIYYDLDPEDYEDSK
ncbi:hypothetical protein Q3G72_035463 [Acer saccharum]|nr:hypothetical protein Q3G72_035463 [Acer saccharum]